MKMNMNQNANPDDGHQQRFRLAELKQTIENDIVPQLERQSGVASVSVGGGYVNQINITVNRWFWKITIYRCLPLWGYSG